MQTNQRISLWWSSSGSIWQTRGENIIVSYWVDITRHVVVSMSVGLKWVKTSMLLHLCVCVWDVANVYWVLWKWRFSCILVCRSISFISSSVSSCTFLPLIIPFNILLNMYVICFVVRINAKVLKFRPSWSSFPTATHNSWAIHNRYYYYIENYPE